MFLIIFLIGRMLMKTFAKAFAVVGAIWLGVSMAQAQQTVDTLTQIDKLKTTIQTQIERIKNARDLTDAQLDLARLRIGEQIKRSEEDLALQVEQLERLKEQLQEQKTLADQTVTRMKTDVLTISTTALGNIDDQLNQTANLLDRMRKIREEITGQRDLLESLDTSAKGASGSTLQPSVSSQAPETLSTTSLNQKEVIPAVTVNPSASTPTTQESPAPTPSGGG
jgi:chromosome segregation ATPase